MAIVATNEERTPLIDLLSLLVGDWEVELSAMSSRERKDDKAHGQASFRWMDEGRLLIYRIAIAEPEFPVGFAVIGFDEILKTYRMLYTDSRGVSRILTMSIEGRTWTLERNAPGFSQRFEGVISDDGSTIQGYWDKQEDERPWSRDFDILYSRKLT